MANHFSALKNARQAERRTAANKIRKTRLRHQIRAMRRVIESKNIEDAQKLLAPMFSMVDRAAKWGIIKANTAARYKSRLHLRVKALQAA